MPPSFPSQTLQTWYERTGRKDLPWRNTADPYAIWISEIMLQQTQVTTVLERYYFPFLARFPTLQTLAAAPLDDVLKAWEGLGYYTRARNLHKAAQQAAPALPETVEELMALPGIGRNTAHAIAAFACHQPVPVMEANVKRILHRLAAKETMNDKELWISAQALVDKRDPFTHNQAMMDVGAMVCTPRAPRCGECPLSTACQGKNTPEAYPAKKAKKQTPVREKLIIIAEDAEGKLYLAPRETKFLGGLYGFPEYAADAKSFTLERASHLLSDCELIGGVEQTYSHFHLSGAVWLLRLEKKQNAAHWHKPETIPELALSRADHKALILYRNVAAKKPAADSPPPRKQATPAARRASSRSSAQPNRKQGCQ